jgi:hypothetical protein
MLARPYCHGTQEDLSALQRRKAEAWRQKLPDVPVETSRYDGLHIQREGASDTNSLLRNHYESFYTEFPVL